MEKKHSAQLAGPLSMSARPLPAPPSRLLWPTQPRCALRQAVTKYEDASRVETDSEDESGKAPLNFGRHSSPTSTSRYSLIRRERDTRTHTRRQEHGAGGAGEERWRPCWLPLTIGWPCSAKENETPAQFAKRMGVLVSDVVFLNR